MKITVSHKYLTLPINTKTVTKKLCFYDNSELVYDLDCKIDMINPDFTAFIDVERFTGRTLDVTVSPAMNVAFGSADVIDAPDLYREPLRPKIHFTVANGWNNDPNGLCFLDGEYHMFYQYNPCSNEWGNMHWGHAVSTDLVHWEERDIALFPDDSGTMYSGSAIIDRENVFGVNEGGRPAMILFYTAAGERNLMSQLKGNKRTQNIAYSVDGGKTFRKYEGNPVIPFIEAYNRDPKVVFVPEIGQYVLALFMNEDRYRLFTSIDLKEWQYFDEIRMSGESECPDLYPLDCEGKRFWILSGASDVYVVGHFEDGKFVIDSPEKRLACTKTSYAAQSFSGLEGGRQIRIAWEVTRIPCPRFASQMSVPVEMKLEKINGDFFLSALPVKEVEALRKNRVAHQNYVLSGKEKYPCASGPLDIALKAEYDGKSVITIGIFGHRLTLDMGKNAATLSCAKNASMPLRVCGNTLDLRIIVDRCSVEIFADGGKSVWVSTMLCDYNLPEVTLESGGCKIRSFECWEMKSIYE